MNDTKLLLSIPHWALPIYILLRDQGSKTVEEIVEKLGVSIATAYRAIATLREMGLMEKKHGSHRIIVAPRVAVAPVEWKAPAKPKSFVDHSFPVIFEHSYGQ